MNGSQLRTSLVGIVLLMAMTGCGGSTAAGVVSPSPPEGQAGGWEALPASPLSPRTEAHAFWTGDRVLVIGGSDAQPCPANADCALPVQPPLIDGAAFEPSSGEWDSIAQAPLPLGQISGTVLLDALYVWVPGSEPAPDVRSGFLVYRIGDDRWEELDAPPVPGGTPLVLMAAEDRIIAYHPTQERGRLPDLLYEPATGEWTDLPADPLPPSFDRTMVWTGDDALLLGLAVVPDPNSERPSLYRAAGLDLATGEWRRLPDSEVVGWNPTWYWAGGRVVNPSIGSADGGEVNNWGRPYPYGSILDPATGIWSPLPEHRAPANTYQGLSAGGPEYVVSTAGAVLHVPTLAWIPLTKPRAGEEAGAAAVWAGDRLFVWGGVRSNGPVLTLLDNGWTWRP